MNICGVEIIPLDSPFPWPGSYHSIGEVVHPKLGGPLILIVDYDVITGAYVCAWEKEGNVFEVPFSPDTLTYVKSGTFRRKG